MDIKERNRKVAIAKWSKIHSLEMKNISKNRRSFILRAKISGFLAGDGSVHKRFEKNFYHYEVNFFPDDELMLNEFMNAIWKLYMKKPKITKKEKVYDVRLSSKVVYEDLTKYAKFGIKTWDLPLSILIDKATQISWLKAFFSAEAYVGKNQIKLQTVNHDAMMKVSNLLKDLGIEHRIYNYKPKIKNHSITTIILILKKEARMKFRKDIGFWHKKKQEIIRKASGL